MAPFASSRARFLTVLLLYPWIVGFGTPHDSLGTTVSIFGGLGEYDYITRDCNNHITSVTEIPFQEAGASVEGPIEDWLGYTVRGGYLRSASSASLFQAEGVTYDSVGRYIYFGPSLHAYYAGGTLRLHFDYLGLDIGALAFSRPIMFSGPSDGSWMHTATEAMSYWPTGGLRVGHLDAWFWTVDFLNDDPLISSRAMASTGLGFALGTVSNDVLDRRQSTLWLGLGGGPYDATMALAEATVPFNRQWTAHISLGVSTAANFEGAISGGLGYSW